MNNMNDNEGFYQVDGNWRFADLQVDVYYTSTEASLPRILILVKGRKKNATTKVGY